MFNKRSLFIKIVIVSVILGSVILNYATAATINPGERWVVWSEKLPVRWEDAFVTGNGRHGTMVCANPDDNRIICTHEELFIRGWDRHKATVPVTSHLIPEALRLMEEGRSDDAARLITHEADRQLNKMGARERWSLIPHPAFDLKITGSEENSVNVSGYRRSLDLETGESKAYWNDYEESVFSSRADNVNVISLKADKKKLNVTLSLQETPGRRGWHFDHDLDNAFLSVENGASKGWLTYRALYAKDPGGYEGVARVILNGGSMRIEDGSLIITGANEALIVIRIIPLEYAENSMIESTKKELKRLPGKYEKLLAPHAREHGEMFRRMQFDLGCAEQWKTTPTEKMLEEACMQGATSLFMEQVQAMGRYLLISSSGKYPPPLQGIWGGSWKPAWIGGFVWDSNINLAISAASMSNLPECALTYSNYVESLLPGWRLNAANYLGRRGFIVAHYNDPTNGFLTHFGASFPWMFWAGGAGWNIRPLYEHGMMTGDDDFLKNRVYPLYREMAEAYEDCLILGNDDFYHIPFSISPENAPPGTDTWLSWDATMDVAIAREVFTLLDDMGSRFGADPGELEKWASYIEKLSPYRINDDGAMAEWVDPRYPDVYRHRHNSHLYPVFPGTELMHTRDTVLLRAAGVALDKRFKFDTSSAHGLIHLALQAARLGDVGKVEINIDRFAQRRYLYDGLVSSHEPNNGIYNLDAVLSFPRLLLEMLVYTEPGKIELMPAWPADYPDGCIKGIRVYGGHTLNISWKEGRPETISIVANSDELFSILFNGAETEVNLEKDHVYNIPIKKNS